MKRMKFRFLACVAMVLVSVMFFEVPVSAVSYMDLADYYTSNTVSDGYSYSEYYYDSSSTSWNCLTAVDMSGNYDFVYGSGCDFEYSVSSELSRITFHCYPFQFGEFEDTNRFSTSSIVFDDVVSLFLRIDTSFYSSIALSGNLVIKVSFYKDGTFVKWGYLRQVVSLNEGYTDVYYEGNILSILEYDKFDSFTFEYQSEFYNVPAGTVLSSYLCPYHLSDELNPGFSFCIKGKKEQESPVFTTNLSTDTVWYLVGSSPTALNVNATVSDGGTISYQWYKSATASGSGSAISGATGKSYTPDTSAESEYYYYCIATSTLDGVTKTKKSNVAHVGVVKKPASPVIYSNLHTGTLEYYQDAVAESLFFGVYAPDGGTLTYQWYEGDPVYGDPKPISGATSSSYTPSTSEIGYDYYYCIATNTKGPYTESICSREGRIEIKAPPDPALAPVITTDLSTDPVTYKEGVAASPLRIIATSPDGGTLSYQWYEVIDGSAQILAGDTNANFTPDTSVVGEHVYYCVITNTVLNTKASVESSRAMIIVQPDRTDSLLDTIIGGVTDIIEGIANLPQLIIDGIKDLFIPDAEGMAAYQDKWFQLLSSRFGAIYEAVVLIDEFGQSISEQSVKGTILFPEVTLDLAGTPWTFGGWEVKVIPDGFAGVVGVLKAAVNIVSTFAFVNGLRRRFEGVLGGA